MFFPSVDSAPCGVPQGSMLHSFLFNRYTNGIKKKRCVPHLTLWWKNFRLQSYLGKIHEWFLDSHLPINASKCHVISFSSNRMKIYLIYYSLNQTLVLRSHISCDMGVIFVPHTQNVESLSYKAEGFIIPNSKNFSRLKFIFISYVGSKTEYASIIGPISYSYRYMISYSSIESLQLGIYISEIVFGHKILENLYDCSEIIGLNFHTTRLIVRLFHQRFINFISYKYS